MIRRGEKSHSRNKCVQSMKRKNGMNIFVHLIKNQENISNVYSTPLRHIPSTGTHQNGDVTLSFLTSERNHLERSATSQIKA